MDDVRDEARADDHADLHTAAVSEDVARFVEISEVLTGFSRYDLRGTGMAELYLDTVRRQIGASHYDALLAILAESPVTDPDWQAHPALLEAARAIVYLWYTGAWPRMAPAAHAALRRQMANEEFVVSSSAYTEGLVWRTFHGHPAGAKPPGYGTWSMAPPPVPPIDEILDELEPDFTGRHAVFTTPVSVSDIDPSMLPGLAAERYVAPSAQPRAAQPGTTDPRAAQPEAGNPRAAAQPRATESKTAGSKTAGSGTAESGTAESGTAGAGAAGSKTAEAGAGEGGAGEAGGGQVGGGESGREERS
ncbi:hypothetical protein [Actinomadura sp. 9N215]|uniref:hypothetical protein n=1 Tax=Actinomadura sp. 9N215 TaxID=3375150 RepID=UPI0037873E88